MIVTINKNALINLECRQAASTCYYSTLYIYGNATVKCYDFYDCYYMDFYIFNGGHLTLINVQLGYYSNSDLYLYEEWAC